MPYWLAIAQGRGLTPSVEYCGPVVNPEGERGVLLGGREVVLLGHDRSYNNHWRCPNADRWFYDLDRPEGMDAAVRELARRVKIRTGSTAPEWKLPDFTPQPTIEGAPNPTCFTRSWMLRSSGGCHFFSSEDDPLRRSIQTLVPGISEVGDPALALAMALVGGEAHHGPYSHANSPVPDDLRAAGWAVAVHNDYRQDGKAHTFWLFTKDGRAVKGEGFTDAEALDQVREAIRHLRGP